MSVTFAPEITGSWAAVGTTLFVDPGSWTNNPTSGASQWYRCDASGANCALIPDTHGFLHTLVADDVGKTLFAVVTATNDSGTGSVSSYLTGVVGAPTVVAQPVISGDTNVDGTLSVSTGTWTGSPTSYAYQWSRCDATSLECTPIPGATASTYTVSASALNNDYLIADVFASNASGSADNVAHPAFAVGEAHTDVISPGGPAGPPIAVVQPYWTGDASTVGNVLIADTGVWREHPTSLSYGWYRCRTTCSTIAGTSQQLTYTVQAADAGWNVEFAVDAMNISGTSARYGLYGYVINNTYSSQSGPAGAPEPTQVPTLTGDAAGVGSIVQVSGVAWSSTQDENVTATFQWIRCDANGASCSGIDGATTSSYQLTGADLGHTIYAFVDLTNGYGTTSLPTSTITPPIGSPIDIDPPVISGDNSAPGYELSASTGDWLNDPTSFGYQWYSCDSGGANCSPIAGATGSRYTTTNADFGNTLMVEVDATTAQGSAAADSSQSNVIGSPYAVTAPVIGSTDALSNGAPIAELGDTLSVNRGTWHGAPTGYVYQWFSCDANKVCSPIIGASSSSHTIVDGDLGHTLFGVVYVSNSVGTSEAVAYLSGAVGVPQPLRDDGSISGTAQVGQTLTFMNGSSWAGDRPITWAYSWRRCDTSGSNCTLIDGASASTYTLVSADAGHVIEGAVRGSNRWGGNGWRLVYDSALVAAAPSAGGGGGGGGAGGGGGSVPLDLSISVSVSPAQVPVGGSATFHITVTDLSRSTATHFHVMVGLPVSQVVGTSTDRGPGCKPSVYVGWLDCDFDYLAGNATVANALITLTFPSEGAQTLTANAMADQTFAPGVDNSASATVQVGTPPQPVPPPGPPVASLPSSPAPVLKQVRGRKLAAVPRGTTETVTGSFMVNEPLRLRMTVTRQGRTRRILLRTKSYLVGKTTVAGLYTVAQSVRHAGTFTFRAVLGRRGLAKGATYLVHLTATNADGASRSLAIPFRT